MVKHLMFCFINSNEIGSKMNTYKKRGEIKNQNIEREKYTIRSMFVFISKKSGMRI